MESNVRKCSGLWTEPLKHTGVFSEMSRLPLWYNADLKSPSIPESLSPYVRGVRYLSTKQVPSCLILRTAGSASVTRNRELLLKSGFSLREEYGEGSEESRNLTIRRLTKGLSSPIGTLADILTEAAEVDDMVHQLNDALVDSDHESSGSENGDIPSILHAKDEGKLVRFRKDARYRIKYDDPWKIHAGHQLGEISGLSPEIVVWSGDAIRIQDPLPPRVLGPTWDSSSKHKVRFEEVRDDRAKLHLIYVHTHWGRALREMCNAPGPFRTWARVLRYRINRFLKGSTDPEMPRETADRLFISHKRDKRARALRLIELLKTVDGIFLQRYLCYPEEVWTWSRFDLFTLGNIASLLGDEFLDGEMSEDALSVSTCYSQLKATRKWFKEAALRGNLEQALSDVETHVPHWCRQFINVWRRVDCSTGARRVYLIGLLSQTRGAGTPPPLVQLQSKVKFLRTIGRSPPAESSTERAIRVRALEEVLDSLPKEAFTGLATKARVTVSTSSSWENTRREGGTIETARTLLASLPIGEQIPVRDLETGVVETYKSREDFDSTGEVVFWLALDHVLRSPPGLLKYAFLTMVKEPGKARTVTKARACLKIVLDLVNKLVAAPLEKGIRSSTSGMGRSNHGWNLFNRLMSDELKDMVFHLDSREENPYEGYVEMTDTFKHLYMSSTDYEEATDQMNHQVASDLGGAWMRKCGIPKLLRAIVHKTCFQPREVFFYATGVLKTLGTSRPEMGENIRSVPLVNGILMGDPLTKVVLHLTNVVARHAGARLFQADFYNSFVNGRQAHNTYLLSAGYPG